LDFNYIIVVQTCQALRSQRFGGVDKIGKWSENKMQDKKYELTNVSKLINGRTLFRIRTKKDFASVKKDELGGWIESENNLSQKNKAWVAGEAQVYGEARVYDNAQIFDNARISGNAMVYGKVRICENVTVYESAQVSGEEVEISGNARIYGDAGVFGKAKISGNVRVYGNAQVFGEKTVKDYERFFKGDVS
jgi:NDP-sugar pyrophosphorylase family protein